MPSKISSTVATNGSKVGGEGRVQGSYKIDVIETH